MHRRAFLAVATVGVMASGCLGDSSETSTPAVQGETLILTSATSAYDTGLLDELNEAFEARFGVAVDVVAHGTGAALATARNGDADVVLTHARTLEDEFLAAGHGINRRDVMFNDFVLVGPADDPAGIRGSAEITAAFTQLAATNATVISRGDNSGTHHKERELWELAGIDPSGEWYRVAGSGMGEVLTQTDLSADAYTLTDRGTFRSMRDTLDLVVLFEGPVVDGPAILANPYGLIAVNPARHEQVAYDLAMAYIGFFTSPDAKTVIDSYTANGDQLFFPNAISADPNFAQYVPEDWRSD